MDAERRAAIIAETRANLAGHRRSDDGAADPSARLDVVQPPVEDAEERQREGQRDAADLFWQSVDQRIGQALEAERAFMTNMLRDALQAVGDAADATADKFSELDGKLNALADLLQRLREGNERARARAEALDVPLPKDLN